MGYDMVISATGMVHLDVQRIRQLLDGKMNAVRQGLDYCPRTCPSNKAHLCTYQSLVCSARFLFYEILCPFSIVCFLHSASSPTSEWVAMACLGTLVPEC
jgi:hypothetical protein